ncbi:uncharacterized protein LOC119189067 [Manduca sexta]|uniref:uncharacterized protein LOC119189067 n=1 Tax=Manduca sexta TaxID=7130 RepID=UPI0018906CD9|nr:uncharacterized protein LOC119189067 [Manduca sexta]
MAIMHCILVSVSLIYRSKIGLNSLKIKIFAQTVYVQVIQSLTVYTDHANSVRKNITLIHFKDNNVNMSSIPIDAQVYSTPSPQRNNKPVSASASAMHSMSQSYTSDCDIYDKSGVLSLNQIMLATALVDVASNDNTFHTVRALLDNGSQHCFISESLLKYLNVAVIQSAIRVSGVGHSVTHSNQSCEINIRSKINDFNTNIRCIVLPEITGSIPQSHIKSNLITIPQNVVLADPSFYISSKIDILIGADRFWDLLDEGRFKLPCGPYLQNSKLGWLLSGPIDSKFLRSNHVVCNISQTLDNQLRKFWELEEIQFNDDNLTEDERQCEENFMRTTKRDVDGRFSVRMPLKESPDVLGDSFEMARSRFLALERKLNRMPHFKQMYCEFMREYIRLGHMKRIQKEDSTHYFLPHHGVWKDDSTTTKLRVVFDASAVTTSNKSLNDIQLVGPALQNDIFSILLRFRQYRYVACADVEKMFRQILIHNDQRNLQLIFWRENSTDSLDIYQLKTVTYGTASAPYLSMRCIRHLAEEADDKAIAGVIKEDFYVDDLITGHDSFESLLDICERTSQILNSGCFPLRKWTFNHDSTTQVFKTLARDEHCQSKTLGLGWSNITDEFHFTTELENSATVTKRVILSVVSQIYDPLGLLSPSIIIAKILLQRLWLQKIDWDDPVPDDIVIMWNRFINSITETLNLLRIPRYVMSEGTLRCELHIFADASQDAYGACAYIKTYDESSRNTVQLLCSKGKVAPVKTITIPRLELCAALLGAKLYKKITVSLRLKFNKTYFWTDSTIVLGWIKMSPRMLKTFVQNRVTQINELTGDALWCHVSSKDNPADYVSRGLYLEELHKCKTWWHGPEFIAADNLNYTTNVILNDTLLPEVKSQSHIATNIMTNDFNGELFDFNRFSSFNRMRRTAAYILRFIYNMRVANKQLRKTGLLSADELSQSEFFLTRFAQVQSFGNNYDTQKKHRSGKLSGLNVFVDANNILRVGGRLNNSSFDYDKKHPVLLCGKHRFTSLLFRSEHKRLLHAGPQLLLSNIRECWWPLGGRNLARKTVHQCVTCSRLKSVTLKPIMGDLPAKRLEEGFPFKFCGVDYAGPVMILTRKGRGAKLIKDPNDALPLTPAHFLVGRPLTAPTQGDLTNTPTHTLLRYDRIEKIRQHFWQRWAKEYVSELQSRSKWKSNISELAVDTIVLVKEDNVPPLSWKLARVIQVYPGKDGVSRVADLRTSSGVIRRAFSKICPLPITSQ